MRDASWTCKTADGHSRRVSAEGLPYVELVFALHPGEVLILNELVQPSKNGHETLLTGKCWEQGVSKLLLSLPNFSPAAPR